MPLFDSLDENTLTPDETEYKRDADEAFTAIEAIYARLEVSPKRLKIAKEFPFPTFGVPYELVTVYALRALELAEGAAALIQRRNQAGAFPVLRSMYELWAAVVYAKRTMTALLIERREWEQFDSVAKRLLLGMTGRGREPFAIRVGEMISATEQELKEIAELGGGDVNELARHYRNIYAEMCNGAHPTQWGIIGHAKARRDGLGIEWHRKPLSGSAAPHLADLTLTLKFLRRWLEELEELAEKVAILLKQR